MSPKPLFLFITMIQLGCASITARPYACEHGNFNSIDKANKLIVGYIFQVGDCALSDTLRIETGEYYKSKSHLINDSVWKQAGTPKNSPPEEIKKFSRAFNCTERADAEFNKELVLNQETIFGEKWEKSEREVTLKIEEIIANNDILKKNCSK